MLGDQRGFNVSGGDKTTVCPGDVLPLDKYSGVKARVITRKISGIR